MLSEEHNLVQDFIKEQFQARGWIAIKEHYIRGKKVDVLAQNKVTRFTVACEVQCTTKHYKENILLDFRAGCDEVWIISIFQKLSGHIEKKAHKELDASTLRKVRFLSVNEFIPTLNKHK